MTDNDAGKIASPAYYDFEMERRKWRRTVWGAVVVTSAVSLAARERCSAGQPGRGSD